MRLEFDTVNFSYDRRHPTLEDVSFTLREGAVTVLMGANGSGKSTLLKLAARAVRGHGGGIVFDGRVIGDWPAMELARKVAYLPQNPVAPDGMTVWNLVLTGRYPCSGGFFFDRRDREAAAEAVALVGAQDLRRRRITELSGGERQKVFLAMMLARKPELLLLDEPISALDPRWQYEVLALIKELNLRCGVTVLAVLHDLERAGGFAGEVIGLRRGRVGYRGAAEGFFSPAVLREIYGVETEVVRSDSGAWQVAVTGVSGADRDTPRRS